jgi:DNA-binding MarR family transcriptional regulator
VNGLTERDQDIDKLDRIFHQIGRRLRHSLTEDTLTLGQYALLKLLYAQQPLTVGEVADQLDVSLAGASGMIDRLVHADLITRTRSETDRRVVTIELTDVGRNQIESQSAQRKDFLRKMFLKLSEDELKMLLSLIERMADPVEDLRKN